MENDSLDSNVAHNYTCADNKQQSNITETGEIVTLIGTKADGELLFQDISQIPHFLVSGFSGAGKTSFVQTITTYLATYYPTDDVRFIIYDSKSVDYNNFNALPHLIMPVIKDDINLTVAISWLSDEYKKRLSLLVNTATKDIISYNKQCIVKSGEKLPHLFVILDDFSSIQFDNDTTAFLIDILKNGRAVGIHFVFVTSLTSSKVLQKYILSNVPCRISFCVSTRSDSRIVIEQNGAESLCVPGELIFRWQNNLIKCQGAYIPDEDIQKSLKKIQHQSKKNINVLGNMAAKIFENSNSEQNADFLNSSLYENEYFSNAVDVVLEVGVASTTLIQRRLKLGYAKAAELVDMMEKCGIVGPYEGTNPRQVLITKAQWQIMKNGDSKPSGNIIDSINNRSALWGNTAAKTTTDEEMPDIEMRDFAKFNFNGIGLCINDNQIKISNKIITKYGPGTTIASFNGKSVAGLTYKKPRMFSRGYIQFTMKPNVNIINSNPNLITITKDNFSDLLKIEFNSNVAHIIKTFMIQISQDTGVKLIEL